MQFDIAVQLASGPRGSANPAGIETELRQRLAHRDSLAVLGAKYAFIESAGNGATAKQGRCEPNAFLIGKADDLDGEGQSLPALVHGSNAGNRRDQPQRPIPFAGIAHGVVMRP